MVFKLSSFLIKVHQLLEPNSGNLVGFEDLLAYCRIKPANQPEFAAKEAAHLADFR